MSIGWPQGIYLVLIFLGVCTHASKNGQPRDGHYDLGSALMAAALTLFLMYWGGFFG